MIERSKQGWRRRTGEGRETERDQPTFHSLVPSLNTQSSRRWGRAEARMEESYLGLPCGWQGFNLLPPGADLAPGSQIRRQRWDSFPGTLIQNVGVPSGGLMCCATTPTPDLLFRVFPSINQLRSGLQCIRIKVIMSSVELDSKSTCVNYFLQKSYA